MRYTQLIHGSLVAMIVAGLLMPLAASGQTLDRIQSSGTINIGFVADQEPFSSPANGSATGYSIDLCQRVADAAKAKLGMPSLAVKYTSSTVAGGLTKVANGEIDILCSAVTDTLERRQTVAFSIPIFNAGIGALIRKDAPADLVRVLKGQEAQTGPKWRATIRQGLADHTYAVHAGTTTEDWVREQIAGLRVTATVVTVDEHQDGVAVVANGEADAYFADRPILKTYANRSVAADDLQLVERYFNFEPIALAVARGDDDFRLVVDTALSELYRSDEFADVYSQHFAPPGDLTVQLFKIYSRN